MRSIFRFILIMVIVMLSIMVATAQDSQVIVYDEVVSGEISDETYEQLYSFEGQAGDTIMIEMVGILDDDETRLDSFLYLRDAEGNELAFDDDAGGNLNALIGPYTFQASGTYTIVATRYQQENGESVGAYELSMTLADFEIIHVGDKARVTLDEVEEPIFYQITVEADGYYELQYQMISGEGNADLSIREADGTYVSSVSVGDYAPSNFTVVSLDAGETLTLILRNYGAYDEHGVPVENGVSIEVGFSVEPIIPDVLDIEANQSVSVQDSLESTTSVNYYSFNAINGQTLSISGGAANEGVFEFYVVLPTGITSFYGGSYYSESDYVLMPQIIKHTGQFLLVVYRSSYTEDAQASVVEYELSLTVSDTPELEAGVPIEGVVSDNGNYEDAYLYRGQAGEEITLTLTSLDDTYATSFVIELSDEDIPTDALSSFYVNFSSSAAGNISYDVTLPYDGVYIIRVYNGTYNADNEADAYRLTVVSN